MDTINSISANIPCTPKTGIYKTNNDHFNDKVHMTMNSTKVQNPRRYGGAHSA